jgi:hypothetical protein
MTTCFSLISNYTTISNKKYIFDNNNITNISFGLFDNSNNNYLLRGVPSNYPLTFFSQDNDISNIINFEALNSEPIIIYVSRGQDISFINGDFFRFYDSSYQLLNINHRYRTIYDSSLTDVRSNFYFMNSRTYTFKATTDFCSNFPFTIYGNSLTTSYSLDTLDSSFTLTIPANADNSNNKLFYRDNDFDISANLYILRDASGLKYYYGDISFSITNYNDFSNIKLSLKSYDFSYGTNVPQFGNKEISNNNLFYYSSSCSYIINNNLLANNEFLNKVSALDISFIDTTYKLSFNKGRHSSFINNNPSAIYDLSFGLGKGSYIIIDISSAFPIRLSKDISNLITIDKTYQPARITEVIYGAKTYYYGSFKIKVFDDFSNVNIELLNRTSLQELIYNAKFFYTDLPHIQGTTYGSIGRSYLKLLNQQSNYYDLSDSLLTFNKYELNLNTNYKEPSYAAVDKYGHNLNILDFVTRIPSSDQIINQEISNNIINGLFEYNILYKVTDYENTTIQNIRTIVVNYGPIIEISSNYLQNNNIYKNDNQYNNILQFQNNTFNSNYNFFDSINVYIYDISRQKINIPFELSISGEYFDAARNKRTIIHDVSYSYTQPRDGNTLNTPFLTLLGKNYYAYYRNFVLYRNTDTDIISIRNYIPSSLVYENSGVLIRTTYPFGIANNIISIGSSAQPITLSLIDQKFDLSNITLRFASVYSRPDLPIGSRVVPLNFTLKLNNYFFEISFNSSRYVSDNFKVSGLFNPINFFGSSANNLIDVSYVGSYNLKISTKGLSGGDYFYDTFKNSRFFRPTLTNSSRTYTINIQDISSPDLTFYDNTNNRASTSYVLNYPRIRRFNILQDICFINLKNFNTVNDYNTYISNYVSNKPLIQYSDNSIYDFSYGRDISFTLTRFSPISNISYVAITKELSLNVITIDSSCVINYRANDICNNWSQDISLTLNFINVPYAELSGNAILSLDFSRNIINYRDAGLRIYTITNSLSSLPFIPREISGNSIYETSNNVLLGSTTYNISYNSDICLNRLSVNDYSFNYIITIVGSNIPLTLSRKVRVVDREPPKFLFQDFSSINYILNDSRLGINMTTYDASYSSSTRYIHSKDTSFNIDFSFVVYRSFNDLSKVLYDFDVSDNYQQQSFIRKTLTFGTNTSPFTFNDISNYFDNSINRLLNKVTTTRSTGTSSVAPRLRFNYTIDDSYNIYSVTRNVDIIDNNNPSITFNFANYYAYSSYPYSYQYVYYDASFKDFSYVALDYNKRYNVLGPGEPSYNFIQELSSILFNFDLSDNFDAKNAINYIITISNNSVKTSITNANELADLSDNIKTLFSLKDTSLSLIYDINDNQFNVFRITRNVRIIDISTNLDISFLNNSSPLTISFGDTNFNILRDVSFSHKRLTTTSISFDISYSFQANTITSVSGSRLFDPSALIYSLGSNVVNYIPSAYAFSFYKSPRIITISNNGPLITFPSTGISHEIYTPLSDASLIFDVTSNSIYDQFFFANYRPNLSYNGTNFKITFDNCLNILEPSAGLYNIYYSSTDLCGITAIRTRILNVADRRPPVMTICGDFVYELSNNSYFIQANSYYKEYGGYSYDLGTRTPFDISIISQRIDLNNNNSILILSSQTLQNTKLIYNDPSYSYRIIYRATDIYNNSQDITRNIIVTISQKPILYPYVEVANNNGVIKYPLTSDIIINSKLTLINSINNEDLYYDVSLSFKYDTTIENDQNIICEAIAPIIFAKGRTNNYVKFALEAKSYDNLRTLASSFVNVEYENIQSLNIEKTHKIYFYARDLSQINIIDQISFLEYNLNFVDTTPPQVTLLTNRNFNTISNLDYPLLSVLSRNQLSININSYANFNNLYNNYENYYKKSLTNNNIVLYDPGINIRDIVSGQVNYIDNSFQKINDLSYDFINSDISINYYRSDGSLIDVCNILYDGCANNFIRNYTQKYNVRDEQGNVGESHIRTINVKKFPPFINLNYQKDCCGNNYITYYHKKFEKYVEPEGQVLDYFDGFALSFENVKITNAINENANGTYTINYDVSNSADISSITQRNVDVITSLPLLQNFNYDFSDILNFNFPTLTNIANKTNVKYSLYNGTYKFAVPYNLAFNIKTQEFDICNGLYIINDVVSITSDSSYNINAKKFYYNNVVLTLSGDFNRLTIELNNNISYKNLFVYNNKNTYIDLYEVINNNENNVIIDSSYVVDVSNLNNPNPNSRPFFVFTNTSARNLHLSIGNYRFYQYGYKNFHNPIKFSITKDGTHNGGIEYTKNIFKRNLPGVSILSRNSNSSYTQINIDATTPATLYYYCENFPNMGGQIVIKNNIIFSKQTMVLNNYIIDSDREEEILNSNYTDDFLKNRVLLTQRFNITGGISDTSYINITCITQQNIQHNVLYNIPQQPHKLIIRKHTDLLARPDVSFTVTNYSIMKNNVRNYLVENEGLDFSFGNTYINLFKYDFDSSLNVAKRESDPLLNIYDEDIREIFYNYKNYNFHNIGSHQLLDEITNYSDFFRKNNLLTTTLLEDSFKYKISEFFFANSSKVLNLDNANEYNYNEKLLAPRIKITNITANYITFKVEIYYNNNNKWYSSNEILSTNKEVLFGTYEYIVYSSNFIDISNVINEPVLRDFVTFYNGSLTITSNLIYSYSAELSNNFYDTSIFNRLGYNDVSSNELTNIIFLSIKDTSNNNASLCGLTEQNLYNNVYFDENQTLIFHKFNTATIVNYQVNSPTLTLATTLSEETNYNKYLINIAENDIYNFYNERPLNFNTLTNLSANEEYNIYIAFTITDELANTNNYLTQFEIEPIYLNNIPIRRIGYIYRQYSDSFLNSYDTSLNTINEISYNSISNRLTSHSYIIDLNDYFDINIYKKTLFASNTYSTDYIDVNKLNYTLLDVCYNIPFNLYDISGSQSVVYNVVNLNLLLVLRNKIIPLYFKLTYMIKVLEVRFPNVTVNNALNNTNSNTNILTIKEDDNINYFINLLTPDPSNLIVNFYTNEVSIAMLNSLYQEIFANIQLLILKFNDVISSYNIRHLYLINITNFLDIVIAFNYINIDYLYNIVTLLQSNVENIIQNMELLFEENNITQLLTIYNSTNTISLANGNILTTSDISYLDYIFQNFYILNNDLDLMRKEVAVRNYDYNETYESYKNMRASNITNNSQKRYKNLYSINNLDANKLYLDLKYNFNLLNSNFILDYSYVLYNYANVINYFSPFQQLTDDSINYAAYNDASIVNYESLYNNVQNLHNIITEVFTVISTDYNIYNKPTQYLNVSYKFFGSKLLINSYYSNSITFKLNIKYNRSLYQSIDLSTIYLDITIPDLTPPTIIFNNTSDICFNEIEFNSDASINSLINNKLIKDLSYIDLNQSYTISSVNSVNSVNAKYYNNSNTPSYELRSLINNNYSLLEIDLTDISNVNFNDEPYIYKYIKYIVLDNANNRNIITRKIVLENDNLEPIFFYKGTNDFWRAYRSSSIAQRDTIIFNQNVTQATFTNKLRSVIKIVDPLLHEQVPNLFTSRYSELELNNLLVDASSIRIDYIDILQNTTLILRYYIGEFILDFDKLMNIDLINAGNNLFLEYFSNTQDYRKSGPGSLIINLEIIPTIVVTETIIDTHCCYPKVEYKPIQDNYKLGSQNTTVMRMAKFIINRHI